MNIDKIIEDSIFFEDELLNLKLCKDYPKWALTLDEIIKTLPLAIPEIERNLALDSSKINIDGPAKALYPFILFFENSIRKNISDLPISDFSLMLIRRLYQASFKLFNLKISLNKFAVKPEEDINRKIQSQNAINRKIEDELTAGGWVKTFEKYPVLARKLSQITLDFIDFTLEFGFRIKKDMLEISKFFFGGANLGSIESIDGSVSDLHNYGRCVLLLIFVGGQRLVYKPRNLEIDIKWGQLISNYFSSDEVTLATKTMNLKDYGYAEYINHKDCKSLSEVEKYYHNCGALLAMVYAFGGNDIHAENIISYGEKPVIVDLETIMNPTVKSFALEELQSIYSNVFTEIAEKSVAVTGMLRVNNDSKNGIFNDVGALTSNLQSNKNYAIYDGRAYSGLEFKNNIIDGFQKMYISIMKKKSELLSLDKGIYSFESCEFRMLIRNSQTYANLINHINSTNYFKKGSDYLNQTEKLYSAYINAAKEESIPYLKNIFKSEQKQILSGYIPIFYCEAQSCGIKSENQTLYESFFSKSPIENARDKIKDLNPNDLRIQLKFIEKSLSISKENLHKGLDISNLSNFRNLEEDYIENRSGADEYGKNLFEEAVIIYEKIMEQRVFISEQIYSFISNNYDLKNGKSISGFINNSLYDGLLGISVFAGALYKITGEEKYLKSARYLAGLSIQLIDKINMSKQKYKIPMGYANGMGGFISAYAALGFYTGDEIYFSKIEEIISNIKDEDIKNEEDIDLFLGLSGLIFSLDKYIEFSGVKSKHAEELILKCAEAISREENYLQLDGGLGPISKEAEKPLTGFAHGAAGIASALFTATKLTGVIKYNQIAKKLIIYENGQYNEINKNWKDYRYTSDNKASPNQEKAYGKYMQGYCAGAIGIGLSRIKILRGIDSSDSFAKVIEKDIVNVEQFIIDKTNEQRDSLCCGRISAIDFFIEDAMLNGDSRYMDKALKIANLIIFQSKKRGGFAILNDEGNIEENPSLFQGIAGIGYQFLRILYPKEIKSILI